MLLHFNSTNLTLFAQKTGHALYRKELYWFPDNAPLHKRHAELLKKSGEPEGALKTYVKALQYDPKNAIALAGKAELEQSTLQTRKEKS